MCPFRDGALAHVPKLSIAAVGQQWGILSSDMTQHSLSHRDVPSALVVPYGSTEPHSHGTNSAIRRPRQPSPTTTAHISRTAAAAATGHGFHTGWGHRLTATPPILPKSSAQAAQFKRKMAGAHGVRGKTHCLPWCPHKPRPLCLFHVAIHLRFISPF